MSDVRGADAGKNTTASQDRAELSSIASVFDEMQARVVVVADAWRGAERDDVAGDLYEVERNLRAAQRRLQRAMSAMSR